MSKLELPVITNVIYLTKNDVSVAIKKTNKYQV